MLYKTSMHLVNSVRGLVNGVDRSLGVHRVEDRLADQHVHAAIHETANLQSRRDTIFGNRRLHRKTFTDALSQIGINH